MKVWRGAHVFAYERSGVGVQIGAFHLDVWFSPRMWSLGAHASPCCRFFLELGPIDIGVLR